MVGTLFSRRERDYIYKGEYVKFEDGEMIHKEFDDNYESTIRYRIRKKIESAIREIWKVAVDHPDLIDIEDRWLWDMIKQLLKIAARKEYGPEWMDIRFKEIGEFRDIVVEVQEKVRGKD